MGSLSFSSKTIIFVGFPFLDNLIESCLNQFEEKIKNICLNSPLILAKIRKAINDNTYFGAKISLGYYDFGKGAFLGNMTNKAKNILNKASLLFFGNECIFNGGGGSIPFISYFQSKYPNTDIICTGIVGSDSREHGPNENLNIEAAKKMICVLCYFLSEI